MNLSYSSEQTKKTVFATLEKYLISNNFEIVNKDEKRPWGGFFVINEQQSNKFIHEFFPEFNAEELLAGKLSPKILIVEPYKKLSWQYHHRRSELWKVIGGEVGVVASETDVENEIQKYKSGSIVQLEKGERHRLIGLDTWGIVAEIWQHSDKDNPSDENDIIRIQDDYGR